MTKKYISAPLAAILISGLFAASAFAATTTVTSTSSQGWGTADTTAGGGVHFVSDSSSPYPAGALQLTTDNTTTAKAQYLIAASTTLSSVNQLSYYTKQVSGPSYADASYQLLVDLNGAAAGGFTTLVYEPYEQASSTITQGVWQQWNVANGQFWSSRSFTDGSCSVTAGAGGAPYYTLSGLKAACPNAVVLGYGVNVGSNNPGYNVYVDGLNFNGTVYNFQLADTMAPAAPLPVSPANGAVLTTAQLTKVDWTDVTDSSGPVTYVYQVSNSAATTTSGAFLAPTYTSGPLTASEIATPNTPASTYYWHVQATDAAGNVSAWSTTWSFTINNGTTTPPTSTHPMSASQCKKGGWKTFKNPSFKNQGQCVSSVQKAKHKDKDSREHDSEDKSSHGHDSEDRNSQGHNS